MLRPGYVDYREVLDIRLLRHEKKELFFHLFALVRRFGEGVRFDALDSFSWDYALDRFCIIQDAEECWSELDCKGRQQQSPQNKSCLGWNNLEVFALPQRDRDLFYAAM